MQITEPRRRFVVGWEHIMTIGDWIKANNVFKDLSVVNVYTLQFPISCVDVCECDVSMYVSHRCAKFRHA